MEFATQASLKRAALMPPEHDISAAQTPKIYTFIFIHTLDARGLRLSNLLTSRRFGNAIRSRPVRWRNPSHGVAWPLGARWDLGGALSRGSHDQTEPPLFNSEQQPPPGACHLANGSSGWGLSNWFVWCFGAFIGLFWEWIALPSNEQRRRSILISPFDCTRLSSSWESVVKTGFDWRILNWFKRNRY